MGLYLLFYFLTSNQSWQRRYSQKDCIHTNTKHTHGFPNELVWIGPFEWIRKPSQFYPGNHLATWAPWFISPSLSVFLLAHTSSHRSTIQMSVTQHATKRRRSILSPAACMCVGVYLSLVMWVNSTWAWCLWPNKWKQSTSYYCMDCLDLREPQCWGRQRKRERGEEKACILGYFILKAEKMF